MGDPEFQKTGGMELTDYIPRRLNLVRNQGIPISRIPHDATGLVGGMNPVRDILGNPIVGRPDVGAIEISLNELNGIRRALR